MDEQGLIRSAQKGDQGSFQKLILMHQDTIYRQTYFMLHEQGKAEEAAEKAILQAYQLLPKFDQQSFRCWILRIATNACLEELRHQKRASFLPFFKKQPVQGKGLKSEEQGEYGRLNQVIQQQMRTLEPEEKAVIVLIDVQGLKYGEAAEILQISLKTLKSRLLLARKQLSLRMNPVRDANPLAACT